MVVVFKKCKIFSNGSVLILISKDSWNTFSKNFSVNLTKYS